MADHDRLAVELADHLGVVVGHLADRLVREDLRVCVRLLDGVGIVGPAGQQWCVPRLLEHLGPALPAARQQPETVDEDDRGAAGRVAVGDLRFADEGLDRGHTNLLGAGWQNTVPLGTISPVPA